ncbi:hypothetical protein M2232_009201 [Bradyrhizobium japonicum]|uniref:hypothetical protein n=1 Tax=Bradyrhizobium japonicum TaxID=375 RepID=UPI002226D122|nr:hypothetical protein [Bradyrhizobium japonicum]MCW2225669.1 hypothetical protein [Bradyrhizobium japonicum]MCW2340881.1 hypothetical protein [Bradyrhizobium japonicum]
MAYKLARKALDRDKRKTSDGRRMTALACKIAGLIVDFTNMDEGGESWATEERIALECACGVRSVNDITELLEDLEWVSIRYEFWNGSLRKVYKFNWALADKINQEFEEKTLPEWKAKKEDDRAANLQNLQVGASKNCRLENADSAGSNMQNLQAIDISNGSYTEKPERDLSGASSDDDAKALIHICSAINPEWEYQSLDPIDLTVPVWLSEVPPPSEADLPPDIEAEEEEEPKAENQQPASIIRQRGLTATFERLMDVLPDIEAYKDDIKAHNDLNDQPTDLGTPKSRRAAAWFQFLKLSGEGRLPPEKDLLRCAEVYRAYIERSGQWPRTQAKWLSEERFVNELEQLEQAA